MATSMMQRAKAAQSGGGKQFTKPNIEQYIPEEIKDVVARVTAAGIKVMYSPDMKDEMQAAIKSQDPIPKRIAENVTGLLLVLDQKAPKGIPQAAIFPCAMELAAEAGQVLGAAGQTVTQEDFNDALLMMYAMIGKKLGGSDEELMGAAAQSLKDGGQVDPQAASEAATQPMPDEQPGEPPDVPGAPEEPDPAQAGAPQAAQVPGMMLPQPPRVG